MWRPEEAPISIAKYFFANAHPPLFRQVQFIFSIPFFPGFGNSHFRPKTAETDELSGGDGFKFLGETALSQYGFRRIARYQPSIIERKRGQAKRWPCEEIPKSGFPHTPFRENNKGIGLKCFSFLIILLLCSYE
jgi:hypothetical protein